MQRKGLRCLSIALLLVFALSGCSKLKGGQSDSSGGGTTGVTGTPVQTDNVQSQVGVDSEDVQFGLSHQDTPDFQEGLTASAIAHQPSTGNMYTEKDGYAYLLDPATLQPVGGPLDPETHEPVVMTSGDGSEGTEGYDPVDTEDQPEEVTTSPSQIPPTESNKYPNTGVFLEDD